VRRGWPSALSFRAEEIFSHRYSGPVGHPRRRPAESGRARLPGGDIHLPPPNSPERRRRVRERPHGRRVRPKRPKRRPLPQGSAIQRPQGAGISRCSCVGVAICQPSTEPIRQRFGASLSANPGIPAAATRPEAGAASGKRPLT
jgi:hypothetical protein